MQLKQSRNDEGQELQVYVPRDTGRVVRFMQSGKKSGQDETDKREADEEAPTCVPEVYKVKQACHKCFVEIFSKETDMTGMSKRVLRRIAAGSHDTFAKINSTKHALT